MAVRTKVHAVTTTAVALKASDAKALAGLPGKWCCITNITGSAVTAYLGGADVSGAANGKPLAQNTSFTYFMEDGDDVMYAKTASGTASLHVLISGTHAIPA